MLQSWYAHALSPFTLHLAVTSIHLTLALHPALTSTSSLWTFPNLCSDPSPVKGRVFVRTKTPNPNIVAAPRVVGFGKKRGPNSMCSGGILFCSSLTPATHSPQCLHQCH
ncbi:hypothetical protein JHK87_053341 [Glycine soja]|nr:hypothetical protein JHK87_053341 [Glycine soja]